MEIEKQIDAAIRRMFSEIEFTAEPAGLYDPLRYMIEIGGKRIRPRLCLLAYAALAERGTHPLAGRPLAATPSDAAPTSPSAPASDPCPTSADPTAPCPISTNPATSPTSAPCDLAPVLDAACALEVFHTFTLLHDDIMDRSPLRRGQQTVWKKWNEDTAILSGDVMLIDAYKRIAKVPAANLDDCLALFSETAAQVCEGQQFDMEFESLEEVSMAEYEKMIGLKTAVLLACSAKMGAIIAGADSKACDALYRYGYLLGLAFQVADDYLDAFGDEKVFGKPIGGDILNCKKSWLTVRACEKAAAKQSFLNAFSAVAETREQKTLKIATVKQMYRELGVDGDARAEVRRYSSLAIEALAGAGLSPEGKNSLVSFADSLVSRAK